MTEAVILWDFDGTLAFRPGMWGGCLIEQLRPFLRDGFPWHRPNAPHPELSTPGAWWVYVDGFLARAYEGVGFPAQRARDLARLAHELYLDWRVGWSLFDDTLPAIGPLSSRGWRHVVLSNHVPELEAIVHGLGLGPLVDRVLSSALTGYEKPHPEAFRAALRACGNPSRTWMVGDNPTADVAGARALGIPAVLVRNATGGATDLLEVEALLA